MSNVSLINALVATTPRYLTTSEGKRICSFRVAEMNEDRSHTNWFTITLFDNIAENASKIIAKGNRVSFTGGLKVRDWDNGSQAGTSVEIEASSFDFGGKVFFEGSPVLSDVAAKAVASINTRKPAHSCNCKNCEM